jgi:hypothetical protein
MNIFLNNKINLFLMICLIFIGVKTARAQSDTLAGQPKDTVWTEEILLGANLSNVGLVNWAGGGQHSLSLTTFTLSSIRYKKKLWSWHTVFDLGYGVQRLGLEGAKYRKTDDRLYVISKLKYNFHKKLSYVFIGEFRTQFAPGYKFYDNIKVDSAEYISNLLAPAYVNLSIGLEYDPFSYLHLIFNPFTSKTTIVNDQFLADKGAYGVKAGNKFRQEYGASFILQYKRDVVTNVNFVTQLSMFANYKSVETIDVYWDAYLIMKINKLLSANITTNLIYDDDIILTKEDNTKGPGTQIKYVLSVGLAYKINGYQKR